MVFGTVYSLWMYPMVGSKAGDKLCYDKVEFILSLFAGLMEVERVSGTGCSRHYRATTGSAPSQFGSLP